MLQTFLFHSSTIFVSVIFYLVRGKSLKKTEYFHKNRNKFSEIGTYTPLIGTSGQITKKSEGWKP